MKILLDECVPTRFAALISSHEVDHVTNIGWSGTKNGVLLRRTAENYDVLVSVDYTLPSQLKSEVLPIPVILLHGESNKFKHIKQLAPELLELLGTKLECKAYRLGL